MEYELTQEIYSNINFLIDILGFLFNLTMCSSLILIIFRLFSYSIKLESIEEKIKNENNYIMQKFYKTVIYLFRLSKTNLKIYLFLFALLFLILIQMLLICLLTYRIIDLISYVGCVIVICYLMKLYVQFDLAKENLL